MRQRDDLLFVLFARDVTHIVGGYRPRVRVNVLDEGLSLAGFLGDYVWPVLGDYRGSETLERTSVLFIKRAADCFAPR